MIKAGASVDVVIPKNYDNTSLRKKSILEMADVRGLKEISDLLRKAGAPEPKVKKRPSKPDSVADSWKRIDKWLKQNASYWKPMKRKGTEKQIAAAEKQLGIKLPDDVKESYAIHNGAEDGAFFEADDGCEFSLNALPEVVSNHKMLNDLLEIGDLPDKGAKPDKGVRGTWWNPKWVPFAGNGAGDYLCIDMDPDKGGKRGQVILMRNDSPDRLLLGPSFKAWLFDFACNLDDGRYDFVVENLR